MKMLVNSRAIAGKDEEYNTWYSTVHVPEMLAIDGVSGCTRHRLVAREGQPVEFLAIYEIDGDINTVRKEIGARLKDGRMSASTLGDPEHLTMTVWEPI
ncbi:DUF4286 family protein [Nocardia macrotermitis]|uniref:EthD domain-containing protein n=1 Tax=Nocardia macrotermitis TaxID=2585198 RepID=A0A7K0CZ73_9NOCA|nr:DUF4286 family protein [Nocardia macrotermitis]MQY18785.1 hypothetical protein [Nocardia macrotermitis]